MTAYRTALIATLAFVLGCNKGSPGPVPTAPTGATTATGAAAGTTPTGAAAATTPTGAITILPTETGRMDIVGALGAGHYAYDKDGVVTVAISGGAGTKVSLQGATGTLGAEPLRFKVDAFDAFLRTPLAAATLDVALTITPPTGAATTATLAFAGGARETFFARLATVASGPVPFPGDEAAKLPKDTLVLMTNATLEKVLGAEGARGFDIDLIAERKLADRVVRVCGTYSNGAEQTQVKVIAVDATDTVYDRRTGKVVGTKTFPGQDAACPENVANKTAGAGATKNVGGTWSESDEEAWLQTLLEPGADAHEIAPPASTHAGPAELRVEGEGEGATNADGGGFPTLAALDARARKAGLSDVGKLDLRTDDYPHEARVDAKLDGSPVELRVIEFGGAEQLATPTACDVGPRRVFWVSAPGPEDAAFIAKLSPKLKGASAEKSAQMARVLAGTGLKELKNEYGSNDDSPMGLGEWEIDAVTPDGTPRAHVHVLQYGHLVDGKLADGSVATDVVAVSGTRVLYVHTFDRGNSQKVLAALLK